jgi:flagellar basal-body rod protein FlgG
MGDSFIDSYSALDARMKLIDVITNNLANANTAGFKRDFGLIFQNEVGYKAGIQVDVAQGPVVFTGNDLNAALDGPGFFVIETPNGRRYTRAGNFGLNTDGELVTKDGMPVLSTSDSPVVAGEGKIEIRDSGVVTVDGSEVASLKVVTFQDAAKIQKEGSSQFSWTGPPEGIQTVSDPPVKGGFLEQSNVSAINEMVDLIAAYREFEAVQRSLRTLMVDMNDRLIQELGKLG